MKRRFNAAISISAVIHKITNKSMLSQRNRAMQCVLPMPHDSDCYLLQLTKGQGRYSTGSQLSTKSRLNVKLKINNNSMAHVFWKQVHNDPSRSSNDTDFGTSWKCV